MDIKFHKLHSGGHATKEEIIKLANAFTPQFIISVHTEAHDVFKQNFDNIKNIERQRRIHYLIFTSACHS